MKMTITDVDQEQIVRLLVRDLRETVGTGHDHWALNNAVRLRQFIDDVESYIQKGNVMALVLRQGATVIGIGLVVGAVAALGVTRLLQGLLWGVTPKDPATFATVIATIAVVALVACLVPVYRALQVSPLTAIRHD